MQRHHRNAATRIGLGTLIVSIVLSLMASAMSPVQAAAPAAPPVSSSAEKSVTATGGRPCGPDVNLRIAHRCADTGTQQFSEGGCGFLQRCIYFSRNEQLVIVAGGGATIAVLICGATALLGCAAASGVVAAALSSGSAVEVASARPESRNSRFATSRLRPSRDA
jgi:hypothetical protein